MRCRGLIALILLPLISAPALAQRTFALALPSQEPEAPPPRPVGDPDNPPVSLDMIEIGSSHEEAWPLPPSTPGQN